MAVLRFHLELIMFRSLFTKYITVFMLIIIVSFIIQISIISTLIRLDNGVHYGRT